MHDWDASADLLAHSVIGYAIERLKLAKPTVWGARPASELADALDGSISPGGIGGHEALRVFRDVLMPACRPMDDPMNLAYVPAAPTVAATMFDLVVSASSIFAGMWEAGAGAIAAENEALAWLVGLSGLPESAGGCFVSGGSAANLSALVTARHAHTLRHPRPSRYCIAATDEVHASVRAAANVMDVDVVFVDVDIHDRMTGDALRAALDTAALDDPTGVFAVVASAGTTNAGAVDHLGQIADVCAERDLWLHVDGAYGLAALCAPSARQRLAGIERADSFGVDPHKWLYSPYDCAALVYRDPSLAIGAHSQHGAYLDGVDRHEWNPADLAYHLSRRARGLPLWFSLATYGTAAYEAAIETTLSTARLLADELERRPEFDLLLEPDLSIVLFRVHGWTAAQYQTWSQARAATGVTLVVPTTWHGETCLRMCIIDPRTTIDMLRSILDDLATG
jgi:glutamate/tyrosine decarboxylase-like PLP-dependent enzyme